MSLPGRRFLLAVGLTSLLTGFLFWVPIAVAAAPAPELWIGDGPFTRNQTIELGFIQRDNAGGAISQRRASNDPATSGGVLTHGVTVTDDGPWTLAAGPAGPRTVYGQYRYTSGVWSPVASITVTLDTTVDSAMYVDADPRGFFPSADAGVDFHDLMRSPTTPLFGAAYTVDSPGPNGVNVNAGDWAFGFGVDTGPITAGTYDAIATPAPDTVGPTHAIVSARGEQCDGTGPVTVNEIAFTADGDLQTLSADFRLDCFDGVISGSIRYGTIDPVAALDQDADAFLFGLQTVGAAPIQRSLVLTNLGDGPHTLGLAAISGPEAGDFAVVSDGCSGATLGVGDDCTVTVRFTVSARDQRKAFLEIPDESVSQRRRVFLQGFGQQPTSLELTADQVPAFGPAEATISATLRPDTASGTSGSGAIVSLDGVQLFGPSGEGLTDPSRRRDTYHVMVSPGHHTVASSFGPGGFYLGSTATPISFDVGIATSLELTTTTDDGVALGEPATLIARLTTGAAIPGGTLQIRDGVSHAVVASASVSGDDPQLTHTVTLGVGSHPYTADFTPSAPTVQGATDDYDLVVVDGHRPETQMDGALLQTNYFDAAAEFSSPDSPVTFECRVNAADWFACTSPMIFHGNPGLQVISVRAIGPDGLADRTPATKDWLIDISAPAVATPKASILGSSALDAGKVKLHVAWTASDIGVGVGSYDIETRADGGAWTPASSGVTSTSLDRTVSTGHTFDARVRGIDKLGNIGDWQVGGHTTLTQYGDGSASVDYSGHWTRSASPSYWGGVARVSSIAGAQATLRTSMRSVGWVSRVGPTRGKAKVYVDGVYVATVDLHAAQAAGPRVVWSRTWSTTGTHRVTVRVSGTTGHPSVVFDGFVVAR